MIKTTNSKTKPSAQKINNFSATRWFAIRRSDSEVIADGETYLECSDAAASASGWDKAPGTVAPYFMTTHAWFCSDQHMDFL
ncbi:hypothetical protein [Nitrosomonas sp.]|uniref:hypothetical protein n=1 Tax=Nitrosomonas sp. TaxID=42353 RepID=UPI0025E0C45E|nr:hypothetical protein [Nitrosomonas sp.]